MFPILRGSDLFVCLAIRTVGKRYFTVIMKSREDKLTEIRAQVQALELPPLLNRKWSNPGKELVNKKSPSIRVMQWNTLAQALTQGEDNFVKCPAEALSWDRRKLHLIEEILAYNADVVCLQEVDRFSYFASELEEVGYSGLFFEKRNSPCLNLINSTGPDGCAVFYQKSQLELISSVNLNIYVPTESSTTLCNQVALCTTFVIRTGEKNIQPFHVVTTHLKAKAGYENLRKEQAIYLKKTLKEKFGNQPMIVCGDFNATPLEPLYEIFGGSDIKLVSVYSKLKTPPVEPPFTTWKIRGEVGGLKESCVTIDYIWTTENYFRISNILTLPSEDEIGPKRLPSLAYPSDHLSLVCDLQFSGES